MIDVIGLSEIVATVIALALLGSVLTLHVLGRKYAPAAVSRYSTPVPTCPPQEAGLCVSLVHQPSVFAKSHSYIWSLLALALLGVHILAPLRINSPFRPHEFAMLCFLLFSEICIVLIFVGDPFTLISPIGLSPLGVRCPAQSIGLSLMRVPALLALRAETIRPTSIKSEFLDKFGLFAVPAKLRGHSLIIPPVKGGVLSQS